MADVQKADGMNAAQAQSPRAERRRTHSPWEQSPIRGAPAPHHQLVAPGPGVGTHPVSERLRG